MIYTWLHLNTVCDEGIIGTAQELDQGNDTVQIDDCSRRLASVKEELKKFEVSMCLIHCPKTDNLAYQFFISRFLSI